MIYYDNGYNKMKKLLHITYWKSVMKLKVIHEPRSK